MSPQPPQPPRPPPFQPPQPVSASQLQQLERTTTAKEYKGHKSRVLSVRWSGDGKRLASGSSDHTARVWHMDLQTVGEGYTRKTLELRGHGDSVDQLNWSPVNHEVLATASIDRTVRLWDVREGRPPGNSFRTLPTPGENIHVCWHPSGNALAVGDKKDTITVFDTRTWKQLSQKKYTTEVNECAWDRSGKLFLMTMGDGRVHAMRTVAAGNSSTAAWNAGAVGTFDTVHSFRAHTSSCFNIDLDPTRRYFAVGSADATVSLWDVQDFVCLRTFGGLDWPVRAVSFSHEGSLLAIGSEDRAIEICNVDSGRTLMKIKCYSATNSLAWNPTRLLLAFAGNEVDGYGKSLGNLRIFGFPEQAR